MNYFFPIEVNTTIIAKCLETGLFLWSLFYLVSPDDVSRYQTVIISH